VARHDALVREAIESNGGVVVKTEGDAFFAAFDRPAAAAAAAVAAQRAIALETWPDECEVRVRMGLHLDEGRLRVGGGTGELEDYVGIDVNYAARIAAAGNGGQIVLSHALVEALGAGWLPTGDGVTRQGRGPPRGEGLRGAAAPPPHRRHGSGGRPAAASDHRATRQPAG
jgi:class 3 adenylate cyclase